jgi:hypothetical protein
MLLSSPNQQWWLWLIYICRTLQILTKLVVISQDEPVYSDSTITDEPLVQQTDEILNADDEDAHPSTDTRWLPPFSG